MDLEVEPRPRRGVWKHANFDAKTWLRVLQQQQKKKSLLFLKLIFHFLDEPFSSLFTKKPEM